MRLLLDSLRGIPARMTLGQLASTIGTEPDGTPTVVADLERAERDARQRGDLY